MSHKHLCLSGILVAAVLFVLIPAVPARGQSCPTGFVWDRMSGVGCKQADCATIPDAHYSYEGYCVCGSSGSINEDPAGPNKECGRPSDNTACPGCVYACVHLNEECPDTGSSASPATTTTNTAADQNLNVAADTGLNINTNTTADTNLNVAPVQADTNISLSTTLAAPASPRSCVDECNKFLRGKPNAGVISASGEYPKCQCQIDVRDGTDRLTQTISVDGSIETTLTFDPNTGELITKTVFDRQAEAERIRQRLGYRYTEAQIEALLASDKIDSWFREQVKDIDTRTSWLDPQFWWQHLVAVFDHGFDGNSADFVDTYRFGRCGDSMQWLERNLAGYLHLGDDPDQPGQKHEAILSITGERWGNTLNHTSLIIRPAGFTNAEWDDIVKELKARSGGSEDNPGIPPPQLTGIDPRLLDAKVLDPYKKQITTVREFIKGWSYIRIS